MASINPEMSPKEFMDSFIPEMIRSRFGGVRLKDLQGQIQVDIAGAGQWVATVEGGLPRIRPGKAADPWATVVFSGNALKMGIGRVAGEVGDLDDIDVSELLAQVAEGLTQQLIDSIRAQVRGTIKLAVKVANGGEEFAYLGINGIDLNAPTCVVQTTEQEILEMAEGGLTPQTAFMAGKIRLEGDISPAMVLAMTAMPILDPGIKFLTGFLKG